MRPGVYGAKYLISIEKAIFFKPPPGSKIHFGRHLFLLWLQNAFQPGHFVAFAFFYFVFRAGALDRLGALKRQRKSVG